MLCPHCSGLITTYNLHTAHYLAQLPVNISLCIDGHKRTNLIDDSCALGTDILYAVNSDICQQNLTVANTVSAKHTERRGERWVTNWWTCPMNTDAPADSDGAVQWWGIRCTRWRARRQAHSGGSGSNQHFAAGQAVLHGSNKRRVRLPCSQTQQHKLARSG